MSDRHFFDNLSSLKKNYLSGAVQYLHSSQTQWGSAYEKGEKIIILAKIPVTLGIKKATANFYDAENGNMIEAIDLIWHSLASGCDEYRLDVSDRLPVGLYFFDFEFESFSKIYGYKHKQKLIFSNVNQGDKFQLSISDFKYDIAQKQCGGIIYQIFVDRFYKSGDVRCREDAVVIKDWNSEIPEYPEFPGAFLKNNYFYGGTIYGVVEKLDYLQALGVNILYLCPIFEAYSNHKYDVGDYNHIDEMFGGDKALERLICECKKRDMSIVLDGVFNHTGADSIYFNKFGRYDSVGAFQSAKSPYFNWYSFQSHPDKYTCWWDIDILPRINPCEPSCFEFFVGEGGVIDKYSKMGIDGFRLDVVDELSDEFISAIRISQNNAAKGTFLYGEVWEDASNKIAYNTRKRYYLGAELDGVMNYPLKSGIIDYIRNKNTRQLEYAINEVMFNMPKRIRDFTMNLLGSHDTERILTALGGENSQGKTNEELRDIRMDKKAYDIARRRLLSAYTVIATLPGIPSVFYGDEVGMEGYSDPFNRRSFPWDNIDNNILSHYKKIGKIRRKNSVYKNGDFELLYLSDDLFAFKRTDGEDEYITVYNNADFDITVEGSDLFKNAFTGRYIKSCVLGPEMACVFVKNKDVQVTIK